ncbi:MAG: PhzF family phenazine biosynthesis protein [Roseiflexaceae bacterium]
MQRQFQLIDVFHDQPGSGNPLAVVFDGEGLSTEQMQQITRWLNLSETTFLVPPTDPAADYHVRIFTLDREIPFAGHPTLGTCHAWLRAGGVPRQPGLIMQQCGAGLVPIRQQPEYLAFAAPPLLHGGPASEELALELAAFLQIDRSKILAAEWADNGPGWVVVLLESAEAVLALNPLRRYHRHIDLGAVGPYPAGSQYAIELRAFFSDQHGNTLEDPVTGSLNASVAQWLLGSGRLRAPYTAAQGTALGRSGRIFIAEDADAIWVGGRTTTLVAGEWLG